VPVSEVNWDFSKTDNWLPLFGDGELTSLIESDTLTSIQADNVKYSMFSQAYVDRLQSNLQSKLENNVRQYRSYIGNSLTRLDSRLRSSLAEICAQFEGYAQTYRETGNDVAYPLRSKGVLNTGALDPVGQSCDFGVAVRIFSYPGNVLSVWAFVVCCTRE
ncbi:Coiled-coil and C2 domain-containing protein 2A, partial [Perkinsus chesapeaki]